MGTGSPRKNNKINDESMSPSKPNLNLKKSTKILTNTKFPESDPPKLRGRNSLHSPVPSKSSLEKSQDVIKPTTAGILTVSSQQKSLKSPPKHTKAPLSPIKPETRQKSFNSHSNEVSASIENKPNKENTPAPKRKRKSSIAELIDAKRFKPNEIEKCHFYWAKAKSLNWFPTMVISTNDAENQKLNISIPIIPQKILKANQLGSATKHLIIFIEENYPMQWVQPENMFEMFINKDVDKNFLEGNYLNSYSQQMLNESYSKAKILHKKLKKFI